jgi:hypothetical protein
MGCLPSRHEINSYKEKRRESIRERRLSRGYSDKDMYLQPPFRRGERCNGDQRRNGDADGLWLGQIMKLGLEPVPLGECGLKMIRILRGSILRYPG